jgi:hypothetical protein
MVRQSKKLDIRLKRAYLPSSADDGVRVLVGRLWPRGVRKSNAAIDRWVKEIAPSTGTAPLARPRPSALGRISGIGRRRHPEAISRVWSV